MSLVAQLAACNATVSICSGSAETAKYAMQTSNPKSNKRVHTPHVLLIMLFCTAHATQGMLFCDGKQDITIQAVA